MNLPYFPILYRCNFALSSIFFIDFSPCTRKFRISALPSLEFERISILEISGNFGVISIEFIADNDKKNASDNDILSDLAMYNKLEVRRLEECK